MNLELLGGGHNSYIDCTNIPSPAIMAQRCLKIKIIYDNREIYEDMKQDLNKPPYRVPLMSEISQIQHNGFNVVSTFSGCGGSCLGYRMAGFKVLWANEFITAAQESYKANHPDSFLDARDIRQIQPDEILKQIGLNQGELDVFDGSPPCASFSTAGKREKGWGKVKNYSDTQQRTDDLFFEYSRILKGLMPKVFIAENVSGLLKGTAKGYFLEILKELKSCGYNVKCKLLDAQWLGVPQMRQRAIFMGVRNDLGKEPTYPKPLNYRYSVRDAILNCISVDMGGRFGKVESLDADITPYQTIGTSPSSGNGLATKGEFKIIYDTKGQFKKRINDGDKPSDTITVSNQYHFEVETDIPCASVVHPTEKRKFTIAEVKRICAFPDDFILKGSYSQQWERCGRAVPPVMMYHIAKTIRDEVLCKK